MLIWSWNLPSEHATFKQRRINVDATLYERHMPAGLVCSSDSTTILFIFILRHTIVAGYYGFTLDVRVSVCLSVSRTSLSRPSVFCFRMITWVNSNGSSPNLVCALILWRSGLGLLMDKFRQILTELSDRAIFPFRMITWVNVSGSSQIWYVHLYCEHLVWDC